MSDEAQVVGLLYRADWTRLCDPDADMPADDPAPVLSPDGVPAGPAVSDEVLHLLQRGGGRARNG